MSNSITAAGASLQARPWKVLFSNRQSVLAAFFIALSASLLLGGYEFIRSPTNTMFIQAYGKQNMPAVMAVMPVGVILAVFFYGWLLTRLGPRRTLFWTSIGSGCVIAACYYAARSGLKEASILGYIFREAYIILIIEQYWSFLNSSLNHDEARGFNGPICGIASIGAIIGGLAVGQLAEKLGTDAMLLFAAASCFPAAFLSDIAYKVGPKPRGIPKADQDGGIQSSDHMGLRLFRTSPVLLTLLGLVLTTQIMSTVTNLSFQGILHDAIPSPDKQTAFSGQFFAALNAFSAIFQFLVAPFALRHIRAVFVQAFMPLVQLGTCAYLMISPDIWSAGAAYMVFKVFDYSLFRASKEIFYIPLPFDARYRAKEVIDVFGYRFGKGMTSLSITLLQKVGMVFSDFMYGAMGLVAAAGWLLLLVPLARNIARNKQSAEAAHS